MKYSVNRSLTSLIAFAFFLALRSFAFAGDVDANLLLQQVDDNLWSNTKHIHGRLIVEDGRKERTLEVITWMEGVERSYSHYLSPPRERDTKMLKMEKKLWMYTPQTDRKILISGHLLRQSMMGSDLSYEDMMEDKKLSRAYLAAVDSTEDVEGVPCIVLMLEANDPTTTYVYRKLWVDPQRKIVLRQELFAKSRMKLKTVEFLDYEKFEKGRLFPRTMIFRDLLKGDSKTTYKFDEIHFDVEIPPQYFDLAILKR